MVCKVIEGDWAGLRELPDAAFNAAVAAAPPLVEPTAGQLVTFLQGAKQGVWGEAHRVLKPGAHVACFGGRTWDLVSFCIRAAGFEFRDTIADVRRPFWEPILVFRKPLEGTVVDNVLEHGTGALNIDACRIGPNPGYSYNADKNGTIFHGQQGARALQSAEKRGGARIEATQGRWPSNLILSHEPGCKRVGSRKVKGSGWTAADTGRASAFGQKAGWNAHQNKTVETQAVYADEDGLETVDTWECVEGCPAKALDEQSGRVRSSGGGGNRTGAQGGAGMGFMGAEADGEQSAQYHDAGGASRFFPQFEDRGQLMQWLIRLICPEGGTLLDLRLK